MKNANTGHSDVNVRQAGRMVMSGFMAAVLMLSTFMGSGVTTALAASLDNDPGGGGGATATIALTDADHGSMAFADTDDRSKEVEVGSTVEVAVKPDDGYTTSSVGVVDKDGNVSAVPVKDGVADVTVKKNATVVAGFYASKASDNQNTEAFATLDTEGAAKKGDDTESTQDYILSHMNEEYTGNGDKLTVGDVMGDTVTVADGTQLPNATLDSLFGAESDKDGDGYSDAAGALVNQTMIYVPLYSASDDGDYFVGRVGADIKGAKVTDWAAAENNAEGKTLDDIIFDSETGLVYVPKSYVKTDKDGNKVVMATRIQLLYTTDGNPADATVNVPVEVNAKGVSGKLMGSGNAGASVITVGTEIQLARDDEAMSDIKADTIDSVEVNGIEYTSDMKAWSYDEETGRLLFNVSPVAITDIKVNMSESFAKDAYRFFDGIMNTIVPDAFAAQSWVGGSFKFDTTPRAGMNLIANSRNISWKGGISGYTNPMGESSGIAAGNYETKIIWQALGYQGVNVSDLNTTSMSIVRATSIGNQVVDGVEIPAMNVNLMCSHVKISVGDDHGNGQGTTDWVDGKANIHIVAVQGNELVFGVAVPSVNTQAGSGFFRSHWELRGGWMSIQKVSAKPDYTNGNSAYDMTGAKYGVYTDRACTNQVATLTVQNNSGVSNEAFLKQGTYYVKELPGSATGYLMNSEAKAVSVVSGEHNSYTLDGAMTEPAMDDPADLFVQKSIGDWDDAGKVMGDLPSLSGIKFRVDYYSNVYDSVEAAQEATPKASAVFATNDNGVLHFAAAQPVDDTSWPYRDDFGMNRIPLGTVVITEVSAIDGLNVMGSQAFTLTDSGDHVTATKTPIGTWPNQSTEDGAVGAFDDAIWRGGVTVSKADDDSATQTPQGDATLMGITYTIYNKSDSSVAVHPAKNYEYTLLTDGKTALDSGAYEFAPNEAIMTITTQETGEDNLPIATTGNGVLPYGTYTITETSANTSYNNANWSQDFEIRTDGQMVAYGSAAEKWNENQVQRGGMYIVKADADTGMSTPQGDAELENTSYDIYNRSAQRVYVNGTWYDPDAKIMTIQTNWDEARNAWVAATGENVLPYGTYEIVEVGAPVGYHKADYKHKFSVRSEGEMVALKDAASDYNVDDVYRGGVSVTKADADWHTSNAQGDATLKGTKYDIVNKSVNAVTVNHKSYRPNEVVMTISTKWNEETQSWVAATAKNALPYGTYQIVESAAPDGYLNANWTQTFTIRQEGEMHYFDNQTDTGNNDYASHHGWNEDAVSRGGVIVGKVDRETGQYISLGEAHLDGATFAVVNKSKQDVYVNGKTYKPGDKIMTIATEETEYNGRTVYAATTGNNVLPYGTYEVHEVVSGTGYLFDSTSKAYSKTFSVRADGQMIDLTNEDDAVANQVLREDWHFQKKAEDSMERMDKIAFLVTSQTTGEKHVIVTDENGTWGSAWVNHSSNTNANDPTSPTANGALGIDEDGDWYVKDSSKLNFDSGVWFTGMSPDATQWNDDGASYTVNGQTVSVNDDLRAFPYDTYTVQELRCDNNVGYKLVNFTVTLHRYTDDHDGPGLDIDYGTIDDKAIAIGTTLTYGASDKVAPAAKDVVLRDAVTYDNLDVNAHYTMKGELHLVNDDGTDGGVVAKSEKEFNSGIGTGRMAMEFNLNTSDLGGKSVVAFEYLTQDKAVIAEHEDITDENQTVKIPSIGTTLKGDIDHQANGSASEITLTDTVSYKNLEVGKQYTMTGTLMDKDTGKAVLGADGKAITAQTSFAPVSENGKVDVTFVFSGVDMAGKTVVAFEDVSSGDTTYAVHADIDDKGQTVYFPSLDTVATDKVDGNHEIAEADGQSITDKVTFTNLQSDYDYYVVGQLHVRNADGTDGGLLTDADGNAYTAESDTFSGSNGNRDGVTLTFDNVDASAIGGKDVVVYDTLYAAGQGSRSADGVVLGIHASIDDKDQTVHVPSIGTKAASDKGLHEVQVPQSGDKTVTLTDTVEYKNLTPGREYTMSGTLHFVGNDGEGHKVDDGTVEGATASTTFTPDEKNGTVDVTFKFDASGLDGKTVVAFESVARNDKVKQTVAVHEDVADEGQTIHFVDMGTTLKSDNGLHETQVPDEGDYAVHLTDTVKYENLISGHEYTLTGTLHLQDTDKDGNVVDGGKVKDADGNVVTATTTFTPSEADGSVDVVFDFMGKDLNGKTVVAFESMSTDNTKFAVHADIADESQTVHFVDIATTAKAGNGLHETQVPADGDKTVTLTDTVEYKNLIPGTEYTMTGTLHQQVVNEDGTISDGGALKDADGNDVTASATFTPSKADGTVDVVFEFDASGLDGKSVVAFETLTKNDATVAVHTDIEDAGQTIHFVDLGTTLTSKGLATDNEAATDGTTAATDESATTETTVAGLHEVQVPSGDDKTITLTDTVAYDNVIVGNEYTVTGTLHTKKVDLLGNVVDGGVLKDADGKDVTATVTFTAEAAKGTVDVTFTFNADGLDGQDVVAFEDMSRDGILIASHADINDEGQTVHFVKVATTAVDKTTGNHMTTKGETVIIVDTVEYTNLIPGNGYKVDGTLHAQKVDENGAITDGGVLKDADGNEVKASAEFVPEKADGTVDVTFEFTIEPGALDGKTVVAFEDLSKDDVVFATHSDITDESQAVHTLKVGTTLTGADNKAKDIQAAEKVDVVDTVAYENLVPGEEYTAVGYLVDAEGKALTEETKVTFKPAEANGTVEVVMTVDTSKMKDGDKIVAFERILSGDTVIGSHEDLKDEGQTVTVKIPSETPTEHVDLQTGVDNYALGIAIAMLVLAALGGGYVTYKRRKLDM